MALGQRPADRAMHARKPELAIGLPLGLRVQLRQLLRIPGHRLVGGPRLVDRDHVARRHHHRRQLLVVEAVALVDPCQPRPELGHAERADRVEYPHVADAQQLAGTGTALRLFRFGGKAGIDPSTQRPRPRFPRGIARTAAAIDAHQMAEQRRLVRERQAAIAQQPDQRARRVSAAREAEDEDFVARFVGADQEAVGLEDLVVEPPAKHAAADLVDRVADAADIARRADPVDIEDLLRNSVRRHAVDRRLRQPKDVGDRPSLLRQHGPIAAVPGAVAENCNALHAKFTLSPSQWSMAAAVATLNAELPRPHAVLACIRTYAMLAPGGEML